MNKNFSYADIVKGLNKPIEQREEKQEITPKQNTQIQIKQDKLNRISVNINGSFSNRINVLLNKILKSEKNNKNYTKVIDMIKDIIIKCNNSFDSIINAMTQINNILNKYSFRKLTDINKSNPNHEYVASNICNVIKEFYGNNHNYSDMLIGDIGGGEGDVIKYIGQTLNISSTNLYCIEQEIWSEKYNFTNNINYIFWDNVDMNLKDQIDVFLLMVSMHHMPDSVINNALANISKQIKKDGLVIIKEHDTTNDDVLKTINWEHHLYHIVTMPNEELSIKHLEEYIVTYISNFKSKKSFDELFESYGLMSVIELNRQFKPLINHDDLNSTNLYWKVYKKINDETINTYTNTDANTDINTDTNTNTNTDVNF